MLTSPTFGVFVRPARRRVTTLRLALYSIMFVTVMLYLKASGETPEQRARYMPTVPVMPYLSEMLSWRANQLEQQITIQPSPAKNHPIDNLIFEADNEFERLMKKQTHDLKSASKRYRKKRGRHPPPGFDAWFKFAQDNNAVIIEEFFDQIYHDLGPFWGLPANIIRKEAWDFEMVISVRNGTATAGSEWFWTRIWLDMIKSIEHLLPDMDLPLNAMDEPRLVVPWDDINNYMKLEKRTRRLANTTIVKQEFNELPPPGEGDKDVQTREKGWEKTIPYWKVAIRGCHPGSLARTSDIMTDFDHKPHLSMNLSKPHTYQGYVSNASLSVNYCHQPDLQGLHGAMIEPLSVSASKVLTPMFGGSKLSTNNEILLPAPMYWANEERFSGGENHGSTWDAKKNGTIWRGVATGGRNRNVNWKGFQRHRFVAMVNKTQATQSEKWESMPENWVRPEPQYEVKAFDTGNFGEWVGSWSNAGFIDLNCFPPEEDRQCFYTSPYFSLVDEMKMSEQFSHKYLPDIDGNSFSGRYRGFLLSTSLPIKATLFREWHDARLIAWKHFVPMDNRFMDLFGIMQYFVGYEGGITGEGKIIGHDKEAEKIAMEGQSWANRVLRREDMQIYVLRLLLEYARIMDDERDTMGFVADLKGINKRG